MNLRLSSGWNPPGPSQFVGDYGSVYNAMNPQSWDYEATPDYIKKGDEYFQDEEYATNREVLGIDILKNVLSSIPFIGSYLGGFLSIPSQLLHKKQSELLNARNVWEARRADWYNNPKNQVSRLRMAGLNPFMQSYVKSYPANVPSFSLPTNVSVPSNSESIAGMINALTNVKVSESRIENLDSLTAINEYKENFLYPQLFEANGYANSISQLQVAWEQNNYDYERLLKQQLLETQFGYSLAQLGEKIIELRPQDSKTNLFIDPINCRVWYVDENGNKVDTTNWKFSDYPIAYQKAWNEVYRMQDLTNANINRIITEANTSSALGALYNANRLKVEQYTTEFEKYGTWPDSDAYLRAAAGAIPWEYINKIQANKLGWSAANSAVGLGVDASKIALNHGLGSYFGMKKGAFLQGVKDAGGFKLPKGARPFINADWNSYNTPYNYNFIY